MTANDYCAMIAFKGKRSLRNQRFRDPQQFLRTVARGLILAAMIGVIVLGWSLR